MMLTRILGLTLLVIGCNGQGPPPGPTIPTGPGPGYPEPVPETTTSGAGGMTTAAAEPPSKLARASVGATGTNIAGPLAKTLHETVSTTTGSTLSSASSHAATNTSGARPHVHETSGPLPPGPTGYIHRP